MNQKLLALGVLLILVAVFWFAPRFFGAFTVTFLFLIIVRGIIRAVLRYKRPAGSRFVGPGDVLLVGYTFGVMLLAYISGFSESGGAGAVLIISVLVGVPVFAWDTLKRKREGERA
ncbi:MAG: hypothetical protein A2991_04295 [Candidatus Terrybacteria bacterium RIFCSPLOWO2_01_FULL_58_14]|uniref:Uncharacterized protein n=2 Tax=Candidatus Terryibacteriota TaxID=1817920 RepID=A0A1G2PW00_9BACT|nr:MAG: hypothetical protein A2682_03445 [Candidatus Terrybacteria bacterium RIFCSPHIGHO2_01_FULL_58_15]OHA52514.1 MAG: hypothetical protein A2991_04295 [Candidatus Terrybacteria bacterium RIFCSPLOWO2_01_FULL_58_14]